MSDVMPSHHVKFESKDHFREYLSEMCDFIGESIESENYLVACSTAKAVLNDGLPAMRKFNASMKWRTNLKIVGDLGRFGMGNISDKELSFDVSNQEDAAELALTYLKQITYNY